MVEIRVIVTITPAVVLAKGYLGLTWATTGQ